RGLTGAVGSRKPGCIGSLLILLSRAREGVRFNTTNAESVIATACLGRKQEDDNNGGRACNMKRYFPIFLAVLLCATALQAQNTEVETPNPVPVYRVVVVARTIKAINYRHRSD